MNVFAAVIAGLAGTAAMTLLMMLAPAMGMPKMDIMGMLGSMVSKDAGRARVIGAVMHFMMGIVFALIYTFLWGRGIGSAAVVWGLIFGLVHGLVVGVMMPMMSRMMPSSSTSAAGGSGGMARLIGLVMGHLVFGLVVALVYVALA
ncbi:MAG: hypothetical protein K1X65_02150 [Caldilineales bacterium]|nr:hypothetical protein [Caldilineales bacterium]MCW5857160.1 hypothetical protein [Caldilineales bacterium]